ncbi:hypothetical protein ACJJH9_11080 [Microbulbifer sp. DLAB2-AF]|uniref:hypothetical protein n=1 Tax=Microbulbifer sp. DLAB2-AF TaxID=3243395 RepID=UPI004039E82D
MIANLFIFFKWYSSLGKKLLEKARWPVLTVVAANILSQVFIILAFLLPLKVLILVSSEKFPSYFPSALGLMDRKPLILLLGGTAALFYVLHLSLDKFVTYQSKKTTRRILKSTKKVLLFDNQVDMASEGFFRFLRCNGSLGLIFLASCGTALLNTPVFLFIVGFAAFSYGFYGFKVHRNNGLSAGSTLNFVKINISLGFLLAFFIMLIFFLSEPEAEVSPLSAIITLVLVRQISSKALSTINDMIWLNGRKNKLNALFFHSHVLLSQSKDCRKGLYSSFHGMSQGELLRKFFPDLSATKDRNVSFEFLQTSSPELVMFSVLISGDKEKKGGSQYLLKIFNVSRERQSVHELELLSGINSLPAPLFLNSFMIDGFKCHLFDISNCAPASSKQVRLCSWEINAELLLSIPSSQLKSSYSRSRQMIWDELTNDICSKLHVGTISIGKDRERDLRMFSKNISSIAARLKALPLIVVNPDIRRDFILKDDGDRYICAHWGRWSLEPIGANWPLDTGLMSNLLKSFEASKKIREDLKNVSATDVQLSAYTSSFLNSCRKLRYGDALDLLPHLNAICSTFKVEKLVDL